MSGFTDNQEGPGSGSAQTQFIESVLSLLFLQKFEQYVTTNASLRVPTATRKKRGAHINLVNAALHAGSTRCSLR
jgi:hypothetical protein